MHALHMFVDGNCESISQIFSPSIIQIFFFKGNILLSVKYICYPPLNNLSDSFFRLANVMKERTSLKIQETPLPKRLREQLSNRKRKVIGVLSSYKKGNSKDH